MLDSYVMKLLATIFLICCFSLALTNQECNEIPSDKIDEIPNGKARRRDGNWQKWSYDISWEQRKTGIGGKVLLQRYLWCPDDRHC